MSYKRNFESGPEDELKASETLLIKYWKQMDQMLSCSQIAACARNFRQKVDNNGEEIVLNLIQSMTLNLKMIKQLTEVVKTLKR